MHIFFGEIKNPELILNTCDCDGTIGLVGKYTCGDRCKLHEMSLFVTVHMLVATDDQFLTPGSKNREICQVK